MSKSRLVGRRRGVRKWISGMAAGLALAAGAASYAATPAEVDEAVDEAVKYLYSRQKPDGSWEAGGPPKPGVVADDRQGWIHYGGETAAATYALLVAGESPQKPEMKKAITWLETHDVHGTYVVGFRSQVWNMIPEQARYKDKLFPLVRDHDADFVLSSRIQRGPYLGFYSYVYGADLTSMNSINGGGFTPYDKKGPPQGSGGDHSNSQYGVLGAWGLEQAGAEIPTQYWIDEDNAWKKVQVSDGGWSYGANGEGSTATMTCAGLATLFITQDYVLRTNAHQFDTCKGGVTNANIEKGLAWMDHHIADFMKAGGGWGLYGMYGIERVGVASGRKYFGTTDWYKVGSEAIVRSHQKGAGWGGTEHDTCFATVFLCRGRAPVMMNKLDYQPAEKKQVDPWNERPRDVANLSKWMGKHSLEGFLNWQIVNLKVSVSDLHDAPILYISGSEDLQLSNQEIEKLRLYVEQGGMILGNADCGRAAFAKSFKAMASKMFPKYEFRRLQYSHPIFDEQYHASKWKTKPVVEAMSNGVREVCVLIPEADPSKAWQTESTKVNEHLFQLGGNIFLYATGKENLNHKGETYVVEPGGDTGREVKVARLDVGNNPDPEPGAWRRIAAIIGNERHLGIVPELVKPNAGALANYKVAHLTGTTKFNFTGDQRKEIKSFIDNGGTLIIDSAGGSADFADSAETELKQMFGKGAEKSLAEPLPLTSYVYTCQNKIDQVTYRKFARRMLTGGAHDPRLRGIFSDKDPDRVAVFYSREDLTAGCVGQPVDGIVGYDATTATKLMTNIVVAAVNGPPAKPAPASAPAAEPATAPTTKPSIAPATRPAVPTAAAASAAGRPQAPTK